MKRLKKEYNLTPMQEGVLFHSLLEPNSGVYVTQWLCSVSEPLDSNAFSNAWRSVVARHDILRTHFEWDKKDSPVQVVLPEALFEPLVFDLQHVSVVEQEKRIAAHLDSERLKGINLGNCPIFRVSIFLTQESEFRFVWTYHHIAIDGTSARLIIEEIFETYFANSEKRTIALPTPDCFEDYVKWIQRQDFSKTADYWKTLLKGFSSPGEFPKICKSESPAKKNKYAAESIKLDRLTTSRLKILTKSYGYSFNTILQAAWSLILHHYTSKSDILFGIIRACRYSNVQGAPSTAGMFINSLPIRVQLNNEMSSIDLMRIIHQQNVKLRQNENTPTSLIQGWSEISAGNSFFESLYVYHENSSNEYFQSKGGRWSKLKIEEYNQNNYPMTFLAFANSDTLLRLEYYQDQIDPQVAKRAICSVEILLKEILKTPDRSAVDLVYMGQAEFEQLKSWNRTEKKYVLDRNLMDLFDSQVSLSPNSIAIIDQERVLTYRELSERANKLGRYLRKLGVNTEVLVGLYIERSLEMVIGIYGILKAGGAYVPLDPEYPEDRLKFMLEDTRLSVVLSQNHLAKKLGEEVQNIIMLDSDWDKIDKESDEPLKSPAKGENAAYVIFTSGSTGRPKGVINEHRGIVNRLLWMQDEYQIGPDDRILQKTPFSFDVSVWEFFWPLQTGAQLVIARPGGHRDGEYLIDVIRKYEVTTLHFVPSMLQLFLEEEGIESCNCIRRVICSGEALSTELQRRYFEKCTAELHNLYGPTEAAVDVTYWACQRDSDYSVVPIGRPVANTQMYILDSRMKQVPIGVAGELYIGGVQVARGYLNRPELTKERFIDDPFSTKSDARLYKTGDLARFLPDGAIEYLGRVDFQVKIHGLRVELGEIEARIEAEQGVGRCVVILREDVPGDKRLVAYFVPRPGAIVNVSTIRENLRLRLPEFMVPQHMVPLDQMPLTSSGKINRLALPRPLPNCVHTDYSAPSDTIETLVLGVWKELLGIERIGVLDNFFDLGGHSLLVMRMVGRLRKMFGRQLTVVDVFRYPTIQRLARYLSSAEIQDSGLIQTRDLALKQREALKKQRRNPARIKL